MLCCVVLCCVVLCCAVLCCVVLCCVVLCCVAFLYIVINSPPAVFMSLIFTYSLFLDGDDKSTVDTEHPDEQTSHPRNIQHVIQRVKMMQTVPKSFQPKEVSASHTPKKSRFDLSSSSSDDEDEDNASTATSLASNSCLERSASSNAANNALDDAKRRAILQIGFSSHRKGRGPFG